MTKKKLIRELNDLLYETIKKYCKENNLIIHKIMIEDKTISFEVWSMADEIQITNYVYLNL
jgi:hypothetical protein